MKTTEKYIQLFTVFFALMFFSAKAQVGDINVEWGRLITKDTCEIDLSANWIYSNFVESTMHVDKQTKELYVVGGLDSHQPGFSKTNGGCLGTGLVAVIKYDSSGNKIWEKVETYPNFPIGAEYRIIYSQFDQVHHELYLGFAHHRLVDFDGEFTDNSQGISLYKMDSSGTVLWEVSGNEGYYPDCSFNFLTFNRDSRSFAVDSAGDVYVWFQSEQTLNGITSPFSFSNHQFTADTGQIFLIKLSGSDGSYLWHKEFDFFGVDNLNFYANPRVEIIGTNLYFNVGLSKSDTLDSVSIDNQVFSLANNSPDLYTCSFELDTAGIFNDFHLFSTPLEQYVTCEIFYNSNDEPCVYLYYTPDSAYFWNGNPVVMDTGKDASHCLLILDDNYNEKRKLYLQFSENPVSPDSGYIVYAYNSEKPESVDFDSEGNFYGSFEFNGDSVSFYGKMYYNPDDLPDLLVYKLDTAGNAVWIKHMENTYTENLLKPDKPRDFVQYTNYIRVIDTGSVYLHLSGLYNPKFDSITYFYSDSTDAGTYNDLQRILFKVGHGAEKGAIDNLIVSNESKILSKMKFMTYPNPFSSVLNLSYELETVADVELSLYDILGKKYDLPELSAQSGEQSAGTHALSVNTASLPSGTYFLRIRVGDAVLHRKLVKL